MGAATTAGRAVYKPVVRYDRGRYTVESAVPAQGCLDGGESGRTNGVVHPSGPVTSSR